MNFYGLSNLRAFVIKLLVKKEIKDIYSQNTQTMVPFQEESDFS